MDNVIFYNLRCNAELPNFKIDSYLVYWIRLCNKASLSLGIVSNKVGESVYKPMTIIEIQKYLKISERTWFRFIKEATINKSILIIEDLVYMNPRFNINIWNINYKTIEIFTKYDESFLEFIDTNGLQDNYTLEPYELISLPTNKIASNKISPKLFELMSKEKHMNRFSYEHTQYKGMKKPVNIFCKEHKLLFEVIAENHLNTNGGCPLCKFEHRAFTYFRLPTLFYIIKIGEIYKIGITTNSIQKRYCGEGIKYEVVLEKWFDHGKDALHLEQWCIHTFKEYKYKGKSPFKNTGISELFTYDISMDKKFKEIINE